MTKSELPPWDVWGAQPQPGASFAGDQLDYFDGLAKLSRRPDTDLEALCTAADGPGVRVPNLVCNALRGVAERPNLG